LIGLAIKSFMPLARQLPRSSCVTPAVRAMIGRSAYFGSLRIVEINRQVFHGPHPKVI
jgi:hypothetical protein